MACFKPTGSYPEGVGIVAMDIFFPKQYIEQSALEEYDGVSAGKYVIGLGQKQMAFCSSRQDIYSLALSAVSSFMAKNADIAKYENIGRLEVATETIMDHSKSIKTVLMQLFEESGNFDVEGIDCTNACYGGTNALFNSLAWVESSAWDGRYAMVVCGDIAEYASGPARPTGGAGVCVMLIGPNAPLVVDAGVRASHMTHAWDFYKPHLSSPFPVVDGALSQSCYLDALDNCYAGYVRKFAAKTGKRFVFADAAVVPNVESGAEDEPATADYVVFHSPYNKLVQKSFARLFYTDSKLRAASNTTSASAAEAAVDAALAPFVDLPKADSLASRDLEKAVVTLSKAGYAARVAPATQLPQALGNMYSGALYAGILSLLTGPASQSLAGKRILCFSYGSGLAASLFSFAVAADAGAAVARIAERADIAARLAARTLRTPAQLNDTLAFREKLHSAEFERGFTPEGGLTEEELFEGEYYLIEKDTKARRTYAPFKATV